MQTMKDAAARSASACASTEEAVDDVLQLVRRQLRLSTAIVAEVSGESWRIRWVVDEAFGFAVGDELPLAATFRRHVARRGEPLLSGDVARDPAARPAPLGASPGVGAFAGTPLIRRDGSVFGALCAIGREPTVFDGEAERTLRLAARLIARELDHDGAEAAHRASRDRFAAFMENSPAISWMKDEAGRFVYASDSLARRFRLGVADILGRTDLELWDGTVATAVRRNDLLVLESGAPLEAIERVPTPDGEADSWHTVKFPFADAAGRRYVGGSAIDITERVRAEEELRRQHARLALLKDLADGIGERPPLGEVALRIIGRLHREFPRFRLRYGVGDGETAVVIRAEAGPGAPLRTMEERIDLAAAPAFLAALAGSDPVIVDDVAAAPMLVGVAPLLLKAGIASFVAVPVRTGPELHGFLGVDRPVAGTWDRHLVETARQVGALLGVALANALARGEMERSEARFRALVRHSADVVALVREDGTTAYQSPAVERVLGYAPFELDGSYGALVHPDDRAANEALWTGVRAKPGRSECARIRVRHRDGRYRWLEIDVTNAADDAAIEGFVVNYRDVSPQIDALRTKDEFVATVSHELRTPLTSVAGFLDLVLSGATGEVSAQTASFLQIAQNNAARLSVLINDLLYAAELDGGAEVSPVPHDLAPLLREVVAGLGPQVDAKAQRLRLEVAEPLPPVLADAQRLVQIVHNLASNAHKYTPRGGEIVVGAELDPADGHVVVSVRDDGIGLSGEEQERLFERFFRARNPLAGPVGGSGLGLAITRSLVQLHGGRIWCESAPGVGSTFRFTLPLAPTVPTGGPAGAPVGAAR